MRRPRPWRTAFGHELGDHERQVVARAGARRRSASASFASRGPAGPPSAAGEAGGGSETTGEGSLTDSLPPRGGDRSGNRGRDVRMMHGRRPWGSPSAAPELAGATPSAENGPGPRDHPGGTPASCRGARGSCVPASSAGAGGAGRPRPCSAAGAAVGGWACTSKSQLPSPKRPAPSMMPLVSQTPGPTATPSRPGGASVTTRVAESTSMPESPSQRRTARSSRHGPSRPSPPGSRWCRPPAP